MVLLMSLSVCSHCGAVWDTTHAEGRCGVAEATRSILENYRPQGATAGFSCPNGHGDGIWHWWPSTGAQGFSCEVCGVVVDHHTGERLDQAEQDRRITEREARAVS
jgi:rubredoxin